jgi:ferritin-like metal-binding protein YciE
MTDTIKEGKLVQYLSEAYGKEKELETALEAHIAMTTRRPYKKRLQEHLKETKSHARELERRIKQVGGGGPQLIDKVAGQAAAKALSLAKGPLHMVRGTGEAEKMLKNAKTEYFNEHEEIATYTAIETLAEAVNDKETAKLARAIRRDEERMATFLAKQIPVLTKAVVTEEIPAAERRTNGTSSSRRRASSSRASSSRSSNGSRASSSRASSRKSGSSSTRKSSSRKRTGSTRSRAKAGSRS